LPPVGIKLAKASEESEPVWGIAGKINTLIFNIMTEFIVKRTGKLLFPHLARDQRKHQMFILMLVTTASLFATGALVMWMTSGRH
jgi:hypothetical protein